MAAALFRRGTGLCVRCVHRELCRLVWRPQTALLSSKASERKQPRRTNIKKAKPQPPLDVAKLLQQLFSQQRPGVVSPVVKAQPAKASFNTASVETLNATAVKSPVQPQVHAPDEEPKTKSLDSKVSAKEESLVDNILQAPAETSKFTVETKETRSAVVEGPVESSIDTTDDLTVGTKITDSRVMAKEELLVENITGSPTETSNLTLESQETRTEVVKGPVESTTDATGDQAARTEITDKVDETVDSPALVTRTISTDSGILTEEPSIETIKEPLIETRISPLETLENRPAVSEGPVEMSVDSVSAEGPLISAAELSALETQGSKDVFADFHLEPTVDATVDPSANVPPNNITVSSPVNLLHLAEGETLQCTSPVADVSVETTIESVEDTKSQTVQSNTVRSGVRNMSFSAREEPSLETTNELVLEAEAAPLESTAVCEDTVEDAKTLLDTTLIQTAQDTEEETQIFLEKVSIEGGVDRSQKMNLDSLTLHEVQVQVDSLKAEELQETNAFLDGKAEEELQEFLVQMGSRAESKAVAESETSGVDDSENLSEVLSKWDSLVEDLQELEGESGTLVNELLCLVPAGVSKVPDLSAGENRVSEEKETVTEAMTLESVTLATVEAEVRGLAGEDLQGTRNELEKEAEAFAMEEKMEITSKDEEREEAVLENTTEADLLSFESISEATDAIEAETSVVLEAMFGSVQGPRQPADTPVGDQNLVQQGEEQEGNILEAMTLESVTLAEVEASLGTLEIKFLSETTDYLEKEAEVLAGEKKKEVGNEVAVPEEVSEDLNIESLSLPEEEALQVDVLMEELLFSVPGLIKGVSKDQTYQEAVGANIPDVIVATAAAATGSADIDAANVTDDLPASSALGEPMQGNEMEEEGARSEAVGDVDDEKSHSDLDPVQRLFLEKIREYSKMKRSNATELEMEQDYRTKLSEETVKLQRLYGGGDLSSFPELTFTEPQLDQDS